jgi:hypothetical protein
MKKKEHWVVGEEVVAMENQVEQSIFLVQQNF